MVEDVLVLLKVQLDNLPTSVLILVVVEDVLVHEERNMKYRVIEMS